jgi:hypothetical protein
VAIARRKFLKTIGTAAVASTLPNVTLGSQTQSPTAVVFWEAGFPSIQGCDVTRDLLQQSLSSFAVKFLTAPELIADLNRERLDLLITPYGSAFPKHAWPVLLKYLRAGGNWLNIGGVPLARPIVRDGMQWRAEPHQTTYHKQLGITHSFPANVDSIAKYEVAQRLNRPGNPLTGFSAREIYELYIRLSSSSNEPD